MVRLTVLSRPWAPAFALLVINLARESSGLLIRSSCPSSRSSLCPRCVDVNRGRSSRRRPAIARRVAARRTSHAPVGATGGKHGGAAGGNETDGAGGGTKNTGATTPAAAPVPQHHQQKTKGKQERVQAAEDSDAPIFYIKGLKEGGGVGVWGKDGKKKRDPKDDDRGGGDTSRARGGGNAAMMARALRNAEREIEGGGNYEEGVEGGEEVEEAADATPVWEKVQASLGLGFWSYVGLGLSVFIIALNNVLGVGWAARFIDPDFEQDSVLEVQQQGRQIQYMPLDDASNLLSD